MSKEGFPRLDDLYHMTGHIYGEQDIARSPSATFAHFNDTLQT
jgi:hypothetical protein